MVGKFPATVADWMNNLDSEYKRRKGFQRTDNQ